eukprot:m.14239 g.14239  ORF g.14239 m.14239 type:complete len:1210 (-) comp6367_c0_seq1:25-3654(-)
MDRARPQITDFFASSVASSHLASGFQHSPNNTERSQLPLSANKDSPKRLSVAATAPLGLGTPHPFEFPLAPAGTAKGVLKHLDQGSRIRHTPTLALPLRTELPQQSLKSPPIAVAAVPVDKSPSGASCYAPEMQMLAKDVASSILRGLHGDESVFFRESLLPKLHEHGLDFRTSPLNLFTALKLSDLSESAHPQASFAFLMLVKSMLNDLDHHPEQYALTGALREDLESSKPKTVAQALVQGETSNALWNVVNSILLPDWERRGLHVTEPIQLLKTTSGALPPTGWLSGLDLSSARLVCAIAHAADVLRNTAAISAAEASKPVDQPADSSGAASASVPVSSPAPASAAAAPVPTPAPDIATTTAASLLPAAVATLEPSRARLTPIIEIPSRCASIDPSTAPPLAPALASSSHSSESSNAKVTEVASPSPLVHDAPAASIPTAGASMAAPANITVENTQAPVSVPVSPTPAIASSTVGSIPSAVPLPTPAPSLTLAPTVGRAGRPSLAMPTVMRLVPKQGGVPLASPVGIVGNAFPLAPASAPTAPSNTLQVVATTTVTSSAGSSGIGTPVDAAPPVVFPPPFVVSHPRNPANISLPVTPATPPLSAVVSPFSASFSTHHAPAPAGPLPARTNDVTVAASLPDSKLSSTSAPAASAAVPTTIITPPAASEATHAFPTASSAAASSITADLSLHEFNCEAHAAAEALPTAAPPVRVNSVVIPSVDPAASISAQAIGKILVNFPRPIRVSSLPVARMQQPPTAFTLAPMPGLCSAADGGACVDQALNTSLAFDTPQASSASALASAPVPAAPAAYAPAPLATPAQPPSLRRPGLTLGPASLAPPPLAAPGMPPPTASASAPGRVPPATPFAINLPPTFSAPALPSLKLPTFPLSGFGAAATAPPLGAPTLPPTLGQQIASLGATQNKPQTPFSGPSFPLAPAPPLRAAAPPCTPWGSAASAAPLTAASTLPTRPSPLANANVTTAPSTTKRQSDISVQEEETDTDTDIEEQSHHPERADCAWWAREAWFKALAADAVLKSNADTLALLLLAGLDPNENVTLGTETGSLLSHAVMNNVNPGVLRLLLRFGADPSAPGPEGILPLHAAAATGDVEVAELLLDYGADPDAPMLGSRITPAAMAQSNERFVLVELLERARNRPKETLKRPDRIAAVPPPPPPPPRTTTQLAHPKLRASMSLDSGRKLLASSAPMQY